MHVIYLTVDEQHGFIRNRSCVTQLLSVFHAVGKSLDMNIQIDMLNWFTDYLNSCVQRVVVDGAASDWAAVTSGVPRGILFGPILFNIFITDFPKVESDTSQTALYADDSKLYKGIYSFSKCENLHQSLNCLQTSSDHNKIEFNATKTPRSPGTGSVWSRHLVRSVYGHIYSYHFFYDTL